MRRKTYKEPKFDFELFEDCEGELYPSEASISYIRQFTMKGMDSVHEWFYFIESLWKYRDYGFRRDKVYTSSGPMTKITLVTGGWSGNEELISAMQKNYLLWGLTWQSSHKGGVHEFLVEEVVVSGGKGSTSNKQTAV